MNQQTGLNGLHYPACVGVEEAGRIFGWPLYFFPVLIRAGHLKPLGKPMLNARKWFATCELERLSRDPVWLDKAIRTVERYVQDSNRKQRGRALELCPAPQKRDGVLAVSD
jgi:hypothetical protein